MTRKHMVFGIIVSALLIVLMPFPTHGQTEETSLDGLWKLTEFRAAGVYSGGAEEKAKKYIGAKVLIDKNDVLLPNGTKCQLVSAEQQFLENGQPSFGSGGGSWEEVGLIKAPNGTYKVLKVEFNCNEEFWGIIAQPEQGLYLLSIWEVYLVMEKAQSNFGENTGNEAVSHELLKGGESFESIHPTPSANLQSGNDAAEPNYDQAMAEPAPEMAWKIDMRGDAVDLSITGMITNGERQRFVFSKKSCDRVIHTFSTYTEEPADFEKLVGSVLSIEFNGEKIGARLDGSRKAMFGQLLYFNLGGYEKDVLLDHLKKNKMIKIKFIDGSGYKAADYFDVPQNEWSIAGISEAFEKAYWACSH